MKYLYIYAKAAHFSKNQENMIFLVESGQTLWESEEFHKKIWCKLFELPKLNWCSKTEVMQNDRNWNLLINDISFDNINNLSVGYDVQIFTLQFLKFDKYSGLS